MILFNERGAVVRIGDQIGSGGEATVYLVTTDSTMVAKLYKTPPNSEKAAKLKHLRVTANDGLLSIAAWPKSLLFTNQDRRTVAGFLMPHILGKEINELIGPLSRGLVFPSAGWDFLIHVARNCAAAFETLHMNGVLMADVNERNLMVASNGLVRLIDCDSCQVRSGNGHFLCEVGRDDYTPPELQARVRVDSYRGLERIPNHDLFGLAILIFQLLFMGRHPFAGVRDVSHDYEIGEAIQRYLFAFSPKTWHRGIKDPPHSLALAALPERLIRLFERAFLPGSELPSTRPTGREWAYELDALHTVLKICNYDPGHKYWNGLASCPWCRIMAGGGPNFFISVAIHLGGTGTVQDVSSFWTTIQRIASGDLMRKHVPPIQLPVVSARPMPITRPVAPRIGKPQAPSSVLLPQTALLSTQSSAPKIPATIANSVRLPLGRCERYARTTGFGSMIFAFAFLASIGLNLQQGALYAGTGVIILLIAWAILSDNAIAERSQRLEAEQEAREESRRRAEKEYARQVEDAKVAARLLAEERAREQSRLEAEYQSKLSAYSVQLSLFENAWTKFEEEKRKWDNESNARLRSVEQSNREMNDTWKRLRSTLNEYQTKVCSLRVNLESAHQRFQRASADEAMEIKSLEANKREVQLRQFLNSQLIRNHKIPGIGPVKAATLLAHGIESALDIEKWLNVTGVGPVLLSNLIAWRTRCEASFSYNQNTPLPQPEVQTVKLKYTQVRQSALVELRGGAGALTVLEAETRLAVNTLESKIPQLALTYAQALADQRECS